MVMLFGSGLRSTSGTNDLVIIRTYNASKGILRLHKAGVVQHVVAGFCKLGFRHATRDGRPRFSGVLWL